MAVFTPIAVVALGALAGDHPALGEDRPRLAPRARPLRAVAHAVDTGPLAAAVGECRPTASVPSRADARGHLDDRALRLRRRQRARGGARDRRDHGVDPRPPRLPRRRARRARSSPASSSRTTRSCSATWPSRSSGFAAAIAERQAHLRPRRLRRRRHLRHRARRPDAARARRGRRLAPAEPLRGGLRRLAATRSRGWPTRAAASSLTVDCGITAVEEVAAAKARGLEVIVTDHHRPGATLPDCPVVATRPSDYPFPELCGTGVVCKLAQALGVDVAPYLDLVALATIADVVPLLDENRSLAIAGLRALARTQRPGLQALMRNAQASIRPPSTPPPSASGSRRGSTPPAVSAVRTPRSSCCSRPTPDGGERLADELETLNRDRQAVESRILRAAVAEVESWPEARRRRRGYVDLGRGLARGRDRDRRVAPRRALQPPRRADRGHRRRVEGLRPLAARLRPARRARRLLRAPAAASAATGPPRASRSSRASLEAFAAAFAAHADARPRRGRPRPGDADRRDRPGLGAHARPRDGARAARAVRARQPRRDAARAGCEAVAAAASSATASTCASACARAAATPARRSRSGSAPSSTGCGGPCRYDVACRLKENRWNGTVAPQLVSAASSTHRDGYEELRARLAELWRAGEDAWTPEARAIFAELALADGVEAPALRVGGVPGAARRSESLDALPPRRLVDAGLVELSDGPRRLRGGRCRSTRADSSSSSRRRASLSALRSRRLVEEEHGLHGSLSNGSSCAEIRPRNGGVH